MKVQGVGSLKKHWRERRAKHAAALERGLLLAGNLIMAESMKQTPVDTGALRASHRVRKVGGRGRGANGQYTGGLKGSAVSVEISVQTAYAIWVHERMDVYHPIGNAKFLENAARQCRFAVKALVEQEVARG